MNKKLQLKNEMTLYSVLNSVSIRLSLPSSQDSSKAVSRGSAEDRAIRDGELKARYALMRACECRRESSEDDLTHSSQPHLWKRLWKIMLFILWCTYISPAISIRFSWVFMIIFITICLLYVRYSSPYFPFNFCNID